MTSPDPATEVIRMRRALPELVSSGAELGETPEDGIRLTVPSDDQFWLTLRLVDESGESSGEGSEIRWELAEVMTRGEYLPVRLTALSTGSLEQMLVDVDTHYRRLLLERRNAACGTPTRARSGS